MRQNNARKASNILPEQSFKLQHSQLG